MWTRHPESVIRVRSSGDKLVVLSDAEGDVGYESATLDGQWLFKCTGWRQSMDTVLI